MFERIRNWRRARVLARSALPEALWREALGALPFLAYYTEDELARLNQLVVLFLDGKAIVGARGHEVTPSQRVIIALQACVPILNLDLSWYDDFENIIVYPDEFLPGGEWQDDAGVVHRQEGPLAGEAMPRGPVMLSWPDVEASADWNTTGMNLVIHEFAHKLDMRDGEANGCPPLPAHMPRRAWEDALRTGYEHFCARVKLRRHTRIDPYAAENPAEFFAVLAEVFFADPRLLRVEYPRVYDQLAQFFAQDPVTRVTPSRDPAV